ncbi:hypothetical protein BCL57_001661 [Agromyces flavus]|uniref:Right handed beta helix region n=1 Tax=Agromyces flavus TaxID=589382 RepID=A0A1H1LDE5_9MICO|nr:right-handed parallel beta-helix repeat-containing protein [Agromyces flavus]MCP2367507.1 hypothetical protein [Agromyces flavus]GGI45594.1 hypothetical protein GCM10010932_10330 [Agromyces flavus]SDR71869.1 Right handed beta helix region [Agromyces flavus]
MSALRRFLATIALGVLIMAVAVAAGILANPDGGGGGSVGGYGVASDDAVQGRAYPGNAEQEAALVAAERGRLDLVSQVAATAPSRMEWLTGPYRVPTGPVPTLVLPARETPYSLAELEELAPESVTTQGDGSILIQENIVALAGAALDLTTDAALRMRSGADGFASIVTLGGGVTAHGTSDAPLAVTSFDSATGRTDVDTSDGRAYFRVVGGTVDLQHASFEDLGFWSGDTGGLALTGTDSPALSAPTETDGSTSETPTLSAPDVNALTAGRERPGAVSGTIADVTSKGNAFGMFVSWAAELGITGLRVHDSLVDGIVLNRSVTATTIDSSESVGNAVDGIVIERSSSGITMTGVNASQNGRNGLSIDARPLALGPSPLGSPAVEYGDVHLDSGIIADNAGYGVRVDGGSGISVTDSEVTGSVVGIAVDHSTSGVEIAANRFADQSRQALTLSGGVDATVHDNHISTVDTGVRIHNASAVVEDNEFAGITNHAVTLVGKATGVRVTGNTFAGNGAAPFYDDAAGGYFARNDVEGWEQRVTATSVVRMIAQPLTIVWAALGVLLLLTAVAGYRHHRGRAEREAERRPLTELTPGIITAEELRGRT